MKKTFLKVVLLLFCFFLITPAKSLASVDFYFTNLRVTTDDKIATIIWNVNQPATGIVSFGLTTAYGGWIQDTRFQNYHETILGGLLPETKYHFKIEVRSNDGVVITSDDYTFETKTDNDTIAPNIGNVRIGFVTANTATVSWETDEDSDSTVYFDTQDGNLRSRRSNGQRVKIHDLTINGLKAATRYFIQVSSKDKKGNERRAGSYTVNTNSGNDQNLSDLQIISLRPFNRELTGDPYTATIEVQTSRPVSGRLRYGEKTTSYNKSIDLPAPRVTDTYIYLKDLKPDTIYYYKLELTDVVNKKLISPEYTFRTQPVNILVNPGKVVEPTPQPNTNVTPYAYGQPRLAVTTEQKKMVELKNYLNKQFGKSRVSKIKSRDWSVLSRAYVYGGYPLLAIKQAIRWGGFTVHPSIGWSAWQNSTAYKTYINK